jgi:hypothetical protein
MASALSKAMPFQVRVISATSRQFQGPPDAPRDCNWRDYSAYCLNSSPETYVENTMVVQKPDGESLTISCTVYNEWSHCTDLPVNQTFQARPVKHGLEIRYVDEHHKLRRQVYEIVGQNDSDH